MNNLKRKAVENPMENFNLKKPSALGLAGFGLMFVFTVSGHLSKVQLTSTFISGGGGAHGAADPFTAIGLNQLLEISKKMSKTHLSKEE